MGLCLQKTPCSRGDYADPDAGQKVCECRHIIFTEPCEACRSMALLKAMIVGSINVLATFVSVASVDSVGRKPLLVQGGIQMMLSLVSSRAVPCSFAFNYIA